VRLQQVCATIRRASRAAQDSRSALFLVNSTLPAPMNATLITARQCSIVPGSAQ
jgi:hypothetical protein